MQELQLAGIDVSARQLLVQVRNPQGAIQQLDLPNTEAGHRQLCKLLTQRGRRARACLESTGPTAWISPSPWPGIQASSS
jgi:hypothetical protein